MYQSIPSTIITPPPPPPGSPRAYDPCSAPHSGAFDSNRSPTHRAFDPSKKCWSSVARKKDFVLHVTSHNSSWFSTTYTPNSKKVALGIGNWALEAIVWRSLKQIIYCFRQCPNNSFPMPNCQCPKQPFLNSPFHG